MSYISCMRCLDGKQNRCDGCNMYALSKCIEHMTNKELEDLIKKLKELEKTDENEFEQCKTIQW